MRSRPARHRLRRPRPDSGIVPAARHAAKRIDDVGDEHRQPIHARIAIIIGFAEKQRLDHVARLGALDEMREYSHLAANRAIETLRQAELDAVENRDRRGIEAAGFGDYARARSEEHTSELQSLMRISYAVFCLKKKHRNKK